MGQKKRGLIEWLRGAPAAEPAPSEADTVPQARLTRSMPKTELLQRLEDRGEIGRGGMSSVRRVFDRNLLREVAMKVLDPELARRPASVQRFLEESRVTGQLEHPNIVPVHELGIDSQGTKYFTMKIVRGTTLTKLIRQSRPRLGTPAYLSELLRIFMKVCDAMAFAHARGVLHRDIKTDNIMVGSFGEAYLMDWGLARIKAAADGSGEIVVTSDAEAPRRRRKDGVVGTPAFMPPEQAAGDDDAVDERSDVFALGAVLYAILTGKAPFGGRTATEAVERARQCVFVPPEEVDRSITLPARICDITKKAMSRRPDDRYQTVVDLQREVQEFLSGGAHFPTVEYAPGTLIIREGDEGDTAHTIVRGHCTVFKTLDGKRHVIRELGPGSVFGETAILSRSPRSASVEAKDKVTVLEVSRESLEEGLGLDTWIGRFVTALAERFRDVDQRLTEIENRST